MAVASKTTQPLSASAIEAFARCPSAYAIRYEYRKTRPEYHQAAYVGSLVHAMCDQVDGGGADSVDDAIDLGYRATPHPPIATDDEIASARAKAAVMARAYAARYCAMDRLIGDDDATYHITGVVHEVALEAPLRHPHTGAKSRTFGLSARIDGVLIASHGHSDDMASGWQTTQGVIIMERKTTSDPVDTVMAWLRQSLQIWLYVGIYRSLHPDTPIFGVLCDVIRKPRDRDYRCRIGRKSKPDETRADADARTLDAYAAEPETFFARELVPINNHAVDVAMLRAWETTEDIRKQRKRGFSRPIGKHCLSPYGGWCEHRGLCWYGDDDGYVDLDGFDGARPE